MPADKKCPHVLGFPAAWCEECQKHPGMAEELAKVSQKREHAVTVKQVNVGRAKLGMVRQGLSRELARPESSPLFRMHDHEMRGGRFVKKPGRRRNKRGGH